MKKTDFTIAIAIYNVKAYLNECMDSIVGQLDDTTELLLVDDGSTDGCGEICDRYAREDSRISVIHQKNGGLSAARNTAIERASGEWIVFADGDDRLPEGAMSAMRKCVHDSAQLIIFDYIKFDSNGQWSCCRPHGNFVIDTKEALEQFRACTLNIQPSLADKFTPAQCITSWGKMWRLSYIRDNGYRFDTTVRRGEDNVFSFAASRNMTAVRVCDDCVYEYRQTGTGIMRRFEPRTPEHYRVHLAAIHKDMLDHGEAENPVLSKGFIELCMEGFSNSLNQVLAHKDCHWSRAERIAWLKSLAQEDWMQEAMKFVPTTIRRRLLLGWMKNKAYGNIDLCCRFLRLLAVSKESLKKRKS